MVGRQLTAKDWDWAGDLTDETEKRRYLLMRDVHATLTQVSFYPDGECFPVLFARIAPSVNPVDAHRAPQPWAQHRRPAPRAGRPPWWEGAHDVLGGDRARARRRQAALRAGRALWRACLAGRDAGTPMRPLRAPLSRSRRRDGGGAQPVPLRTRRGAGRT